MESEAKKTEIKIPDPQEVKQENKPDWTGLETFKNDWKIAQLFANSTLIPKAFQNNMANIMIASDMSRRTGVSLMAVMQNLYIVNGNPSWSSQFIITIINNSNRFKGKLKFKLSGKGDSLECFAYVKDTNDEELIGPTITMQMAKGEGWTTKNGSKWKTMPEVMIQYRAASFFGRMYCPDLLMGLYAEEEQATITEVPEIPEKPVIIDVKPE